MKKDILYSITCLVFTIIIGGAVYEHLNIVPKWAAAPPASLSMFQGEFGLKPELFWMIVHPVTLVLFTLTLIWHWKSQRRKSIITAFAGYIAILVITSIYFVPELISITTTGFSQAIDAALIERAGMWETLSIVRLFVLVILALVLFLGLAKNNSNRSMIMA